MDNNNDYEDTQYIMNDDLGDNENKIINLTQIFIKVS